MRSPINSVEMPATARSSTATCVELRRSRRSASSRAVEMAPVAGPTRVALPPDAPAL